MKLDQLKDRDILIVTRDVTNPKPDRRMTRQFDAAPVWKAGWRLIFRKYEHHPACLDHDKLYGSVYAHDKGFADLIDACEPAPHNLDNVLFKAEQSRHIVQLQDIIVTLMAQGKVDLDDVVGAIAAYEAQEDAKRPQDA